MSYKVGIIGFKGMGGWHQENINSRVDGLECVAVYDINPEMVKNAEKKGLKGYYKLEDILADESIDIITIATPNDSHMELSIAALRAGKNVVCEKPVTLNTAQLERILAVSKEQGKLFSVHQNRRWDRDFNIVKEVLAKKTIGKPFYIESRVLGSRGIPGDWRCAALAGGGMLYDWGVHLIDQILWMVDSPVTQIYAQLLKVKYEVDDNIKILLKFENGISALIEVGTYCFINLPRWHVSGDSGTLVINDWDCNGRIVKANTVEFKWEESIIHTSAGPTKTMAPRPKETIEELPLPKVETDWTDYYKNYIAALEGRQELIVKPEEALRVMKVIDACFDSDKYGVAINCCI